jgi:outer membrane protein insertion porin family
VARFVPALLLILLHPDTVRAQGDFPSGLKTIAHVRLEGRRHVPAKEIRTALKTRPPSILPWRDRPVLRTDFLEADVRAIEQVYRQHGYLDARADYRLANTKDEREVIVTFVVDEGPQSLVRRVEFTGVKSIQIEPIARRLYLKAGRPFNPSAMLVDTARISAAYKERGMLPHVVPSARRESLDVVVFFEVEEGPVYRNGRVELSKPPGTVVDDRLVYRELLIKPDDVFRASRVQRSVERLYETGLFSQARITTYPDSTNTRVDYGVQVRERKPRWIDAGVGSGTSERFRFIGEWGHRNLMGRGVQGVIAGRLAFDGQARFLLSRGEASMLEPWLFHRRVRGLASIYGEVRHDRPDTGKYEVIKQTPFGARFQLRHDIGRFARTALTLDNTFVSQEFVYRVPDSAATDLAPRHYTTRRLLLSADRDTRDDPLNPARGSVQSFASEAAGGPLRGTSSFTKVQFASSWYTPRRRGWVLASRLAAGIIDPYGEAVFSTESNADPEVRRVPFEDRFRIGGVNSLRGYDENELPEVGGLAMFQANAELRVPLIGPFGIELFVDAGNVWPRMAYIRLKQFMPKAGDLPLDRGDVRYHFGAGARVNLPFGPLRVDFTWSPRPDENGLWRVAEPQFAIGPSF